MQFLRYALTGGLATVTHYLVLMALVEGLRVAPPWAAAAGALCGAVVAYAGNRRFTFADSGTSHARALPRFALVALFGAALNGIIVGMGIHSLGLHYLLAQLLATATVLVLGFRLNKAWSFA